jgi:hypothetical protein
LHRTGEECQLARRSIVLRLLPSTEASSGIALSRHCLAERLQAAGCNAVARPRRTALGRDSELGVAGRAGEAPLLHRGIALSRRRLAERLQAAQAGCRAVARPARRRAGIRGSPARRDPASICETKRRGSRSRRNACSLRSSESVSVIPQGGFQTNTSEGGPIRRDEALELETLQNQIIIVTARFEKYLTILYSCSRRWHIQSAGRAAVKCPALSSVRAGDS